MLKFGSIKFFGERLRQLLTSLVGIARITNKLENMGEVAMGINAIVALIAKKHGSL